MVDLQRLPRYFGIAALIIGLSVGASAAQNLSRSSGPAEVPPSSFKGNQYVDSKGCAFIRAGYGGRVSWIPRVSRSRKLLCGFRPTYAKRAVEPVAEQPARRVVQPAPRTVVKSAPTSRTTFRSNAAPQINPNSRIAPRVKPVDNLIAPCVGASAFSSQFINKDAGVRCGPQTGKTRTIIRREILQQGSLGNQRTGPKGVNRRIADARTIKPPKGYRAVHQDGRLNPLRGVGTSSGQTQMAAVWSNTVPRVLIDPATGKPLR